MIPIKVREVKGTEETKEKDTEKKEEEEKRGNGNQRESSGKRKEVDKHQTRYMCFAEVKMNKIKIVGIRCSHLLTVPYPTGSNPTRVFCFPSSRLYTNRGQIEILKATWAPSSSATQITTKPPR